MALTSDELIQAWDYVSAQMQRVRVNELPLYSVYGELALNDYFVVKMSDQDKTVKVPFSAVKSFIGGGAGGLVIATPAMTLSVASDTQINISWLSVANADNYKLYKSLTPNFNDSDILYQGTSLLFNDTDCLATTTYYYWLQATGSGFLDSQYATGSITTTGATGDTTPPVLVSMVVNTANPFQIILTYNEALQAIGSGDTSKYTIPGFTISSVVVSGTTVTLTLTTQVTGSVAVLVSYSGAYVKDLAGNPAPTFSNQTATNSVPIPAIQLSAPTFSATASGADAIDLIWSGIPEGPNLAHFEIQKSLDGTTWTAFQTTTDGYGSSSIDSGLTANTLYYYRIRSVGNGTTTLTSNWAAASATTNVAASYNVTFSFLTSTSQSGAGVNAQVQATNANIRLRFQAQTAGIGTNTMTILVSLVQQMRVDFPTSYVGQPFEFVDTANVVHTEHFINGTVHF